ncbi:MAG: hypothetical protein E6J83_17135, partial [Deltaproteobacteria bacterium]
MRRLRVERTDRLRSHARPPAGAAGNAAPLERADGPAVQDRRLQTAGVDLVPEGGPGEGALVAPEVVFPDRGGLVDVAVDVDDRHGRIHPLVRPQRLHQEPGVELRELEARDAVGARVRLRARPLGELIGRAGEMHTGGRMVDIQTLSFVFEAVTWLGQVLLSGMLDLYPKLRMAIFESNATWLPSLLEHCDRLFQLYRNERALKTDRLPSEAFRDQCFIAFESDEVPVFRQWDLFADWGVWSSDAYHHDGSDSWSAIRGMREAGVPEDVQAKLLGGNARRMYGVESRLFVTDE